MPNEDNIYIQHQLAFMRFLQGKAQETEQGARYALGNKYVSIPITEELIKEFVEKEQLDLEIFNEEGYESFADNLGLISKTGLKSGVIECRITHPEYNATTAAIANTASTIPLELEMESQVSLVVNATYNAILAKNPGYTEPQKNELKKQLEPVKQAMFQEVNKAILKKQIEWLAKENKLAPEVVDPILGGNDIRVMAAFANDQYKDYQEKNPKDGVKKFNQYCDGLRKKLSAEARQKTSTYLASMDVIKNKNINGSDIEQQFEKTPSSTSDRLIQNSSTGALALRSGTEHTAHDKQAGETHLALVRILLDDGRVMWRVPSIAPTNAKGLTREEKIADTEKKLAYIVKTITAEKNGGHPNDVVYYNLLTSYAGYNDSHQTENTEIIIDAVHQFNAKQVAAGGNNLVLLNNTSVNQVGIERGGITLGSPIAPAENEIYTLIDLSLLKLLQKELADNPEAEMDANDKNAIRTAATTSFNAYKDHLANTDTGKPKYYYNSPEAEKQKDAIEKLKKPTQITKADSQASGKEGRAKHETPSQQAAKALYKMFKNGTYAKREYGMLVQALCLVVETNKFSGCKSANERNASVTDKSTCVSDKKFRENMDKYLNGEVNEGQLYAALVDVYNQKNLLEGVGQDISCTDQSMTAKAKIFTISMINALKNSFLSMMGVDREERAKNNMDTNCFEPEGVTNLSQNNAGACQAHALQESGKGGMEFEIGVDLPQLVMQDLRKIYSDIGNFAVEKANKAGMKASDEGEKLTHISEVRAQFRKRSIELPRVMKLDKGLGIIETVKKQEKQLGSFFNFNKKGEDRIERSTYAVMLHDYVNDQMIIINDPKSSNAKISQALHDIKTVAAEVKKKEFKEGNTTLYKHCDDLIKVCEKYEKRLPQPTHETGEIPNNDVIRTRSSSLTS